MTAASEDLKARTYDSDKTMTRFSCRRR
ncbi:hypothetical protein NPIL_122671, partial [Nephila pilipes]